MSEEGDGLKFIHQDDDQMLIDPKDDNTYILTRYDSGNNRWELRELASTKEGGGKAMVKGFVDRVGPGKDVVGVNIIENHTVERLKELGVFDHLDSKKYISILGQKPSTYFKNCKGT